MSTPLKKEIFIEYLTDLMELPSNSSGKPARPKCVGIPPGAGFDNDI